MHTCSNLPNGYTWSTIDLDNDIDEVYNLLSKHYVEDDKFRFDYSKSFLLWALKPPDYIKEWHLGIRNKGKLYAFISGIPVNAMAEINFLCIHRFLRSKRLAPVLIKELTRRINISDVWQAVYTAGIKLQNHSMIGSAQYWHKGLRIKKLIDIEFMNLAPRMTLSRTIKLHKLGVPKLTGLRLMQIEDILPVCNMLNTYLKSKTKLHIQWNQEQVAHWFLPSQNARTYIIQDKAFLSYYLLESTILNNSKHNRLYSAYSFYNVVTGDIKIEDLMSEALICAYNDGCDVFNCLNIMENASFLKSLKFNEGNGKLHYYLHNASSLNLSSNEIGIVLV